MGANPAEGWMSPDRVRQRRTSVGIALADMAAFLYILQSTKDGRYYIGSTTDIEKRFKEHQSGRVRSTKAYLPYKLVFKEEFPVKVAESLELKLKRFKSRKILEKIIKAGKILKV